MIIVVDVNPIISAFLKDSAARKIILTTRHTLYFPEPALAKIEKYKPYIIEKAGFSEKEFEALYLTIFRRMNFVSKEKILSKWRQATKIMEKIDTEDITFVAAALSLQADALWSDDKHFDKQTSIKVLKTEDMMN